MVLNFLSQRTGTVNLPLYSGSESNMVRSLTFMSGAVHQYHHASSKPPRTSLEIKLLQVLGAIDIVRDRTLDLFGRRELPSLVEHERVDDAKANHSVETLEGADDQGTMRPGAGIANIEMVAVAIIREGEEEDE